MADIGGFPVHNYGSDPLGRMGLEMMKSSLDWDEKQKILERQALQEAAKREADMSGTLMKEGGLTPDMNLPFSPGTNKAMLDVSSQKRKMNFLQELNQTADYSKKKQDYQVAEINRLTTSLDYWQKKKTEGLEAGENVVPYNDNLEIIGKKY